MRRPDGCTAFDVTGRAHTTSHMSNSQQPTGTSEPMSALRYPIGRHALQPALDADARRAAIDAIAEAPAAYAAAVAGLDETALDTPYRPGGWTVRQVVHHVADSHMNAFIRVRLALTEDDPRITAYDQDRWAALADSRTLGVDVSLSLLAALHARWMVLWRSLSPQDFARTLRHPEAGSMTIDAVLGLYAWHGRHHVAQIRLVHPEG